MCLVISGLGAYWTRLGQTLYLNEQRFYMNELVSSQAYAIERRLSRSLSATSILAQGVRQAGGLIVDFDHYAKEVLQSVGGVSNLQLAPAGVIRYIYPLEGNEQAIGHDILKDGTRRKEALLAIKEHLLTLAGPFELIQGGIAVVGRKPVYLPSETGERFWGFVSALIYLDKLLNLTELASLEEKGYSYELSRRHPDTGEIQTFAQSRTPLTGENYAIAIQVPNSRWLLTMSRAQLMPKWRSTIGYISSMLAGILFAWVAYFILHQPDKLRQIVLEKTRLLEDLAYRDHLTGLVNRRYLSEQLQRIITEYSRYANSAVLMYLDLDDFKRINDSMGHAAGDALLCEISARLNACVRSSDIVARLGGDEFGILLLDASSVRDARIIAEKLIATTERPVLLGNKEFSVSASIGVTLIPADGDSDVAILKNADLAMYSAKKSGKRNFCFYDQSLQTEAIAKRQLEADLLVAVKQQQFVLHYQPIVDLTSGKLTGYEALIRWQHPVQGLLNPDKFIGVAEDTGQICAIGYWVIKEVCRHIKQTEANSEPSCWYSINLSPKQFKDPLLLDTIRNIVNVYAIDASLLEFEVTESCVMEEVEDAINTLQKLKVMGISVAIDDFGTGYSCFSLLKNLPTDKLKIDMSFIHDLETDINDQKIVQGLISMAHKLHLTVVAEGIETKGQQQLLISYQCDFGQGYLFGKPEPKTSQIMLADKLAIMQNTLSVESPCKDPRQLVPRG